MTRPVLHFAHANGLVSACYTKFLNELARTYEVRVVPALGTNPAFPVDNNWKSLTEQVRDSVESQASPPVIGIGHSLGAMTTYMAGYRYPHLFRAMVLMEPPIFMGAVAPMIAMAKMFGLADRVTPAGQSLGRRDQWPDRQAAYDSLRQKRLFRDFDEECFRDYMRYGLSDDPEGGVRLTIPVSAEVEIFRKTPTNSWSFRRQLAMPSAVIGGETSEINASGLLDKLARKHHMLRLNHKGGHMFPLEHPLEAARLVKDTIEKLVGMA